MSVTPGVAIQPSIASADPVEVASTRALSAPAVAWNGNNGLAVWSERRNGDADIWGQLLQIGGAPSSQIFLVARAPGDQTSPRVAYANDKFIVVWEDRRSDPLGDIYSNEVGYFGPVNDAAGRPVSATANLAEVGPVVASSLNTVLVAWSRGAANSDVVARRLRLDGSPLGSVFVVSAAQRSQSSVSLAHRAGAFFAAWSDNRSGSSFDIYGSRISASGTALDAGGIRINDGVGHQTRPSVAGSNGGYYAVWEASRSTGSDIVGTAISDVGVVRQPAGVTISNAAGVQERPSVAFGPDGYAVVWTDRRGGGVDLRGTTVKGTRVASPAGAMVAGGAGSQFDVSLSPGGPWPLAVWVDDAIGVNRLFGGNIGFAGAGGTGFEMAQLPLIDASIQLRPGRSSFYLQFASSIDASTLSVADLAIQSPDPAETIETLQSVAGTDNRTFIVTVGGSPLDEYDVVSLIDGSPVDDRAEVFSPDGFSKASRAWLQVPRLEVPTVRLSAVSGRTRAFATFSLPIDLSSISTADFAVTAAGSPKQVVGVTSLDASRMNFEVVLDGNLEAADVVALIDGVPADGSAEVLTDDGAKSLTASVTVSANPPGTATIAALHGASWATVTFDEPIDVATLTGSDFAINRPAGMPPRFPTVVTTIPGSGNTIFTLGISGPVSPGDVISLVDGALQDGLAEITTVAGSKVELTSTTVLLDNVKPQISIAASQGRAFVVTFSELVSPQLFGGFISGGTNVDDLFLVLQGGGVSAPTFGGNASVICSGLRCVVQWTTGAALVPGNTVSVDAARFSDMAGNFNTAVTAVVTEDSTAPTVVSADLQVIHTGADRIDIVQGGPRLTITAVTPGDSGLSVEIISGTEPAPSIAYNTFTGLISLARGTTAGSNTPAALADLVNNHPQLSALVTATSSGTTELVASFAFPLLGGTTTMNVVVEFSEDVVGSNMQSLIADVDGNLVTLGDQIYVGASGLLGSTYSIVGVPTSLQEGVSKLIVGQVTDLSGNPITPGTVLTLT